MKISRILHAGYVFESGSAQILFDPVFENPFSRNCYAYPSAQFDYEQIKGLKPDAVFISHYHDDHCSFESLNYLRRDIPIYVYCIHEEFFKLIRLLGFENVYSMQTDVAVNIGPFAVVPRLALDPDVDSVFELNAEGLNVLNAVDAWIDPVALEKLSLSKWDMVLWPFQVMRETEVIAPELALPPEIPAELLEQLRILNPRTVVPSSCQFIHEEWSWYRKAFFPVSYSQFQMALEKVLPAANVYRMNPGSSIQLTADSVVPAKSLTWVTPSGPQDVDYSYDTEVMPTPTADIAKNFRAVTVAEKQKVLDFCQNNLLESYREMGSVEQGHWKLALFDHEGKEISICYEIKNHNIRLAENNSDTCWVTEVPLVKVYNALAEGESLSSMYVRMHGIPFDNIFEDPLVSSLSRGDFFSYQRHQLKLCVPQT